MDKSVLISIRPKWCEMIATGEKTIELRKSRPKMETPFKCYIYRTFPNSGDWCEKDGRVIGEFVCDDIDEISVYHDTIYCVNNTQPKKLKQMCLTLDDVISYLGDGNHGYTWHISDLKIYDTPKELSEFETADYKHLPISRRTVERPPQSWMYVEK